MKDDERKKFYMTTQRFNDYCTLYVATRRKKERREIRRMHYLDKDKKLILMRKKRADTELDFFPVSNMFVRWVMSSLMLSLWNVSPEVGLENFRLLTSSWLIYDFILSRLALKSPKTQVVSPSPICVGGRKIRFRSLHTCVHDLRTSNFPLYIFRYHECFSLAFRKLFNLFI